MNSKIVINKLDGMSQEWIIKFLSDEEKLKKYEISKENLSSLMKEFLTNNSIIKYLKTPFFNKSSSENKVIFIKDICSNGLIKKVLYDKNIIKDLKKADIAKLFNELDYNSVIKILIDKKFLRNSGLNKKNIEEIIISLDKKMLKKILDNPKSLITKLRMKQYNIIRGINAFSEDEEIKMEYFEKYKISTNYMAKILLNLQDEIKIESMQSGKYKFKSNDIALIISTMYESEIYRLINNREELNQICRVNQCEDVET